VSKVIYILSDNRSGSTLLDQLLGAHPKIVSLGEVHHLAAYVRQDRRLYDPVHPLDCSCGRTVTICPFWTRTAAQLGRPLDTLKLHLRYFDSLKGSLRPLNSLRRLPKRIINRSPNLLRYPFVSRFLGGDDVGADSFSLFNAIFEVTGSDYLVDSSKSAFRFRSLYDFAPSRVLAVRLVRDYRGTVYSKMKRGKDMEVAARDWVARMREASELTEGIPPDQVFRLKYEDLCQSPEKELMRLCNFLDIKFVDTMLSRPTEEVHHLGGSPSKFDPARKNIQLDQGYLKAFTADELARLKRIVGVTAAEWGYD
jgi:hypothetical protein